MSFTILTGSSGLIGSETGPEIIEATAEKTAGTSA